jgi:hypothetical protein
LEICGKGREEERVERSDGGREKPMRLNKWVRRTIFRKFTKEEILWLTYISDMNRRQQNRGRELK